MDLPHAVASKDSLRSYCRRYRSSLNEGAWQRLSASIIDRVWDAGLFEEAGTVHIFWPIVDHREVDTRPLIERLQTMGKRILIPAVAIAGPDQPVRMDSRLFTGTESMQRNAWGTYEPLEGPAVPPQDIDVVVVPALAADREGYRLGYGGGFYDRFLKDADCTTVSLVYSPCLFDCIPRERHDMRVEIVATEDEVVRPGSSATSQPSGS